ncbi:MAG: hypothetical protein JNL32_04895 [Candidatus Kapabacteria bacterium]|nr:hypothetical protein [Candidatus Kapabacteria bacterium]
MTQRRSYYNSPTRDVLILCAIYCLWCAVLYSSIGYACGTFTYTLDDAYIHAAMAKNIATYGTWGVHPDSFAGASSSPLWTLLLGSSVWLIGYHTWLQVVMNMLFGLPAIILCYKILVRVSRVTATVGTMLLLSCGSLSALSVGGMEHTMHIALCLLMIWRMLFSTTDTTRVSFVFAGDMVIAALCVAARYESIALCCVLALLAGSRMRAVAIGLGVVSALSFYGVFSMAQGGWFIPNSILVKAGADNPIMLFHTIRHNLSSVWYQAPELIGLCICAMLMVSIGVRQEEYCNRTRSLLFVSTIMAAVHCLFAKVGAGFRYEAYCITLLIIGISSFPWMKHVQTLRMNIGVTFITALRIGVVAAGVISLAMLVHRGLHIHHDTVIAATNIRNQQFVTASVLNDALSPDATCAINDIGVIASETPHPFVDIVGLGDNDVLHLKRSGRSNSATLDSLLRARNVEVIAFYEYWWRSTVRGGFIFPPAAGVQPIPERWIYCGEIRLQGTNVICGAKGVQFYATDSAMVIRLKSAVMNYGGSLLNTSRSGDP